MLAETKTSLAISLFRSGELKSALAIFSTFRIGFSEEERRTLKIAYESLTGKSEFYEAIGVDTHGEVGKAKEIIETKYKAI